MPFGRWETIRELGRGGQGIAYLVRDSTAVDTSHLLADVERGVRGLSQIGSASAHSEHVTRILQAIAAYLRAQSPAHTAVLKVLHDKARTDSKALARLRTEIDVVRRVDHPHIIKILDAAPDEGWYVTPYYADGTLSQHLARFKGDPITTLHTFQGLVEAVAALHAIPVVHRDIKPENIFVSGDDLILGDFGIVYFEDAAHTRISDSYENVGSRDWMPGWAMSMRVDEVRPSFDVFCLGKVLWAMVSGRTKLRLWYWDREEFDLRRQFPIDERMPWINRLLQGSVREEENHTWRTATHFLSEVERVSVILRRLGQVVSRGINRTCRVCGNGFYELVANEDSIAGLNNLGFRPSNERLRVFACHQCGHVDVFRVTLNPPAWGPETGGMDVR